MRSSILLFILFTLMKSGYAQLSYVQINGNASPAVNSTVTYTASFHTSGGSTITPLPSGTGSFTLVTTGVGTVISSDNYSITIQWTAIGSSYLLEYGFDNGTSFF